MKSDISMYFRFATCGFRDSVWSHIIIQDTFPVFYSVLEYVSQINFEQFHSTATRRTLGLGTGEK